MNFFDFFLSKSFTGKINRAIELFTPPVLSDRKLVACLFNYLQGKGFRYYDVTLNPEAYPRGKRDSDCTVEQKNAVFSLIKGKSVLDVGCGSGSFLRFLAKKGKQCVGVDPNCVDGLEENLQFRKGVVQDFNYPAQSFDNVLSLKTLEHVPEARSELTYLRSLAKKRVILILPCQRYRRHVYDGHINFYPDEYQLKIQLGLSENAVIKKIDGEWLVHEVLRD